MPTHSYWSAGRPIARATPAPTPQKMTAPMPTNARLHMRCVLPDGDSSITPEDR